MVRSDLVARVAAENPHLYGYEAEAVVDAILGRIAEALAAGDRVELRGFGTFEVRHREARAGRNPRNQAAVEVAAKDKILFRPGKLMHALLNPERNDREATALRRAS